MTVATGKSGVLAPLCGRQGRDGLNPATAGGHHTISAPGVLPATGVEVISGLWGVGNLSRSWLRLRLDRVFGPPAWGERHHCISHEGVMWEKKSFHAGQVLRPQDHAVTSRKKGGL